MNPIQRRDSVRPRQMLRPLLLLLATAGLLVAPPALAAEVTSLSGLVEKGRGEPPAWTPLATGETLAAGDRVRTGDDGRAEIRLARATIRLYPNSLLRVPDEQALDDRVGLERGRSLFDVLRGERPFEVRTPDVVVSVKGTCFSIHLDGAAAAVAVFRGTVGVRGLAHEAMHEVLVREGFVASGRESFELRALDAPDPWDGFSAPTLPDLPRPEAAGARSASLEETRRRALDAARGEAVARAAERHPHVREKVSTLRAERSGEDGQGLVETTGMLVDDATEGATGSIDAVADAPAALAEELETSNVELWLNGRVDGGGSFEVQLLSGSNQVMIELEGGSTWMLDQSLVESVVAGDQGLPQDLVDALVTEGVTDTTELANQLLPLFR